MKDFFVAGLVELNFQAQLDELSLNVGSSLVIGHQVNPQLSNLLDPGHPAMALELDGPLYWFNEGNRIISLTATVRRPAVRALVIHRIQRMNYFCPPLPGPPCCCNTRINLIAAVTTEVYLTCS